MSVTGQFTPTHLPKVCKACGSDFFKRSKLSLAQWTQKEFCSNACRGAFARKDQRFERDGGRALVWVGDELRRRSHVVMEAEIGRPLTPAEVVDHINGDPTDDSPENLRLFASQSEHMAAHWAEGTIVSTPGMGGARRCRTEWPVVV